MASSSSEASTKVDKNGQGILSHAQGSITDFHVLESVTGKADWNVHKFVFVFDYGLEFCQKHHDDRCTIKYLPGNYGEPKFDNKLNTRIELVFKVTGTPECTFSGDKDKAKEFPLARLYGSFTHVAIEFKWQDFKPSFGSIQRCRQELSHMTRGSVSQLPESNEAVFLKQMRDVSEAESKAQAKSRKQSVDVQVTELEKKIAAVKGENADAMARRVEEREREMREDEEHFREIMRRKAEKFTVDMDKLRAEGQRSVVALEEEKREEIAGLRRIGCLKFF